jgi:ABC-type nitrate/sulfonate/bicarbonate transport system ATPase subunit
LTAAGPALRVAGVRHTFAGRSPVEVLDGVDLVVGRGEFVSLVGPSGCGKSTLLRVLAGLLVPVAGEADIGGVSTVDRPGAAAFMPQRDLLLPWRRALANATLGAEVSGHDLAEAEATARGLFERFGLAGFEEAWPSELSGGMRQRLALLRTFLQGRDVLLLDEPFGALDALTRRRMYAWLEAVWLADRRTVLFVTHDVEEAISLSDRVLVMSARPGRIVEVLDVPEPRPRPLDVVTEPWFVAAKRDLLRALERPDPHA